MKSFNSEGPTCKEQRLGPPVAWLTWFSQKGLNLCKINRRSDKFKRLPKKYVNIREQQKNKCFWEQFSFSLVPTEEKSLTSLPNYKSHISRI